MCEQVASSWPTRQFDEAGVQRKLASPKVADRGSAATEIEKTLKAAKASVYKDWWLRETLGELKPTQPEVLGALGVPLATTNYDGLLEHALCLQGATWRTHGLVDQILTGTLDVTLPESRYHFLLLRESETHALSRADFSDISHSCGVVRSRLPGLGSVSTKSGTRRGRLRRSAVG